MASFHAMTVDRVLRWWPPIGMVAVLILGWVVGKGATAVDDWFTKVIHPVVAGRLKWFLATTDWRLLTPVLVGCVAVALYRRQGRLAAVVVACPLVAITITEVLKRIFVRYKHDALCYPSGHVTVLVAVMAMVVLVAGGRLWAVTLATIVSLVGIVGQASTYHYLTDTVGAAMLSTAVACITVLLAGSTPSNRGSPLVESD